MALFDVDVVLSVVDVPSGLDEAEVTRRVTAACRTLVGLGRATVTYVPTSDERRFSATVRAGEGYRLSDDAVERLAEIVRASVRKALFPRPEII